MTFGVETLRTKPRARGQQAPARCRMARDERVEKFLYWGGNTGWARKIFFKKLLSDIIYFSLKENARGWEGVGLGRMMKV